MSKRKKILMLSGLGLILIVGFIVTQIPNPYFYLFYVGDRYDSKQLNYMNVPYEDENDILMVNGGFSTTNSCPWARQHLGFDYEFRNNSNVIAAAPGKVVYIDILDLGEQMENRYVIHIFIQFNATVSVNYGFEPWTRDRNDAERQIKMFSVKKGDWVNQSQIIGKFLRMEQGAHIHFGVSEKGQKPRLDKYFSAEGHAKMMILTQKYHPEWPHYCFDENMPLDYLVKPFDSNASVRNVLKTWSLTETNPWGSINPNLEFQLNWGYTVRAIAPGKVIEKRIVERTTYSISKYYINLSVAFNNTIEWSYIFETGSNNLTEAENQLGALEVNIGQWIPLNWSIGLFRLSNTNSSLKISVLENGQYYRIDRYFSQTAKQELTEILHIYHPGWSLVYL